MPLMMMIVLLVLCVLFLPFVAIWSVNVLFGLSIPFTVKTFFAALFLGSLLSGNKK